MDKMPLKVNNITGGRAFIDRKRHTRKIGYTLNADTDEEEYITVILPENSRPFSSIKIINNNRDFVNGYKVVQTANKEYAYIREKDNTLLPFRYDIATDFNRYGYAMVGKDGNVSWIDKNFNYLNSKGEMVKESPLNEYANFDGFYRVDDFSNSDIPLSRVCYKYSDLVSYFGTNGKLKEFYNYDGKTIEDFSNNQFLNGTCFYEGGYATTDNRILLSKGYSIYTKDLISICDGKGFFNTISKNIEKQEKSYAKFLRDVENNTINIITMNDREIEYEITGIECQKEELISKYGKEVYERAREDDIYSKRKLAYLIIENQLASSIIDLNLLESFLAQRGIPSYIDYENNVFHYNGNKHVKRKG